MFRSFVFFIPFIFLIFGCATKNLTAEKSSRGPEGGHLFELDDSVVEVVQRTNSRLLFYFYNSEMKSLAAEEIQLKDGILDPHRTKANYSIYFINRGDHFEGVVTRFTVEKLERSKISFNLKRFNKFEPSTLDFE